MRNTQIQSINAASRYETVANQEWDVIGRGRDQDEQFDSNARIYSNATLADYFCGRSLLVVLNKETTFNHLSSFNTLKQSRFSGVNAHNIIELTSSTREVVYTQSVERRMHNFGNTDVIQDEQTLNEEDFRSIVRITLNKNCRENVLSYIRLLQMRDYILYVGPNFMHEEGPTDIPNESFIDEYGFEVNNFKPLNVADWDMARINSVGARAIASGLGQGVIVGIIDTGIDGSHPSLIPNLNNNLHRVFQGGQMFNIGVPNDSEVHGTNTAGVVRKVAPNANLVSLRINEVGAWFSDNVILAVNHATANGIHILNYSGRVRCRRTNTAPVNDPALAHAINVFPGLFVAASGNESNNNDTVQHWPSNYSRTHSNVISVGASDRNDRRASFSNWGQSSVNVFAPGVEIRTTTPGGGYTPNYSGTSAAAPLVAGVAALMLSVDPTITPSNLRAAILTGSDEITINTPLFPISERNHTGRRLNAHGAVYLVTMRAPRYITEKVIDLLGPSDPVVNFLSNIQQFRHNNVMFDSALSALPYIVMQPNFTEYGVTATGTHHYIVRNATPTVTGGYFRNNDGNFSRSARTRLEDHYSSALNAFWNNDMSNAIKFLGYAIHYLTDIGNTVNTTGITGNAQRNFYTYLAESFHDPSRTGFHATSANIRNRLGVFADTFEGGVNYLAHLSAIGTNPNGTSFFDAIRMNPYGTLRPFFFDPIIQATMPSTQQFVAALLHQFYADTVLAQNGQPTHRSKSVLIHGRIYFIKNVKTSFYLDVQSWATATGSHVHQFAFSGDTNQQFRAIYRSDNASFQFEPVHAPGMRLSFMNDGENSIIRNNSQTSVYQRFRPTYLEDGRFRIMTNGRGPDGAQFGRVLRVTPGSNVFALRQRGSELNFNPDSLNHYWTFVEVVELSQTQLTFQREFRANRIYRIRPTTAGIRNFIQTGATNNTFEISSRERNTGNTRFAYHASVNGVSQFSRNLTTNRIYYLRVMNGKFAVNIARIASIGGSVVLNQSLGGRDAIYFRLQPNARERYRFESEQPVQFFNNTGTRMPIEQFSSFTNGRWRYDVNMNRSADHGSRETYYIRFTGTPITMTRIAL